MTKHEILKKLANIFDNSAIVIGTEENITYIPTIDKDNIDDLDTEFRVYVYISDYTFTETDTSTSLCFDTFDELDTYLKNEIDDY